MKPESNRPITIEDLLRLKRAERPPAEFWTDFDRKLRAKQLAALVEKRPWWQALPRISFGFSRYRIVLGASAVFALSFFALREYRGVSPVPRDAAASLPTAASLERAESSPGGIVDSGLSVAPAATFASFETKPESLPLVAGPAVNAVAPIAVSRLTALDDESGARIDAETQSPASRLVAANSAPVPTSDRVATRGLLVGASGFEARVMPSRLAVEPLQQMTPPSDTRRSRLLTAMVSTALLETSVQTSERAASRMISEERLYDQIHRFGARGDRVQVKF